MFVAAPRRSSVRMTRRRCTRRSLRLRALPSGARGRGGSPRRPGRLIAVLAGCDRDEVRPGREGSRERVRRRDGTKSDFRDPSAREKRGSERLRICLVGNPRHTRASNHGRLLARFVIHATRWISNHGEPCGGSIWAPIRKPFRNHGRILAVFETPRPTGVEHHQAADPLRCSFWL